MRMILSLGPFENGGEFHALAFTGIAGGAARASNRDRGEGQTWIGESVGKLLTDLGRPSSLPFPAFSLGGVGESRRKLLFCAGGTINHRFPPPSLLPLLPPPSKSLEQKRERRKTGGNGIEHG